MANILGVRIDEISKNLAIEKCAEYLSSRSQQMIFTPNPEILVKANGDQRFKDVLNGSAMNLCDGFGLFAACRVKGMKLERVTGVDFMVSLCALAEEKGESIYLLGSGDAEVVKKTAQYLSRNYPKLKIAGMNPGPVVSEIENGLVVSKDNETVLKEIQKTAPSILFVAFGMGKQEKWLAEFLPSLPSVRIGMVVGGTFDFMSGKIPRAPLLLRKIGLEWAYRLWKQPQRIGRILNAIIIFGFLFFKDQFRKYEN